MGLIIGLKNGSGSWVHPAGQRADVANRFEIFQRIAVSESKNNSVEREDQPNQIVVVPGRRLLGGAAMSMGTDSTWVGKKPLRRIGGMADALSIASDLGFSVAAPPTQVNPRSPFCTFLCPPCPISVFGSFGLMSFYSPCFSLRTIFRFMSLILKTHLELNCYMLVEEES